MSGVNSRSVLVRFRANNCEQGKDFVAVEKSSDFFLCLLGFMKAAKFRDSSEFLDCVQHG